ncbi:rRNA maturation RNase YbeY [Halomonas sp. ANAO-440]|uniref:rRNA maturation RNase YbeY n=1 Tax=Halomonas sp. ANAO-440 TaxID=2861360 RepID=UPI001CAA7449|nr:rRNA maturation RNase YbeY [Halomonas sp. ANAO-440]MBZ0328853.1 rRNA maturation RNase YbeY [Halomonas sp. ANAO-440]
MSPHAVVDRQIASTGSGLPVQSALQAWVDAVLAHFPGERRTEVTIRIVDADEGQALNRDYRGRDRPTNVLSFPFEAPPGIELPLLGDLVICHPVVQQEALEQDKRLEDHYAHLVVHGTLHLLGHDHIDESEADTMEQLERDILATFSIADPYLPVQVMSGGNGERHFDSEDERLDP